MNRLLFGDNLKPKRSGDAAVSFLPQWCRNEHHQHFPDASVDLVYLDPPFNSNANDNVLFKEAEQLGKLRDERAKCQPQAVASGRERSQPSGAASQAQFHAFTDTWEWTREVDDTYRQFVDTCPNASVVEPCPERSRRMVEALKKFLKPSYTRRAMPSSAQTSPMMAYLAMMAPGSSWKSNRPTP